MTTEEFIRVRNLAHKMFIELMRLDEMAKEAEKLNDSELLKDIENQRKKLNEIGNSIKIVCAEDELKSGATIN